MFRVLCIYAALFIKIALGCGGGYSATLPPGPCPEGYDQVGDSCYQYNLDFSRTWDEARDYCKSIGGDLAVIHTCDHYAAIVRQLHMSGQEVPDKFSYWVGGTDRGDEGAWFWVDGLPMAMGVPFWGEVEGVPEPAGGVEQNCAQLYKGDRYYIHDGQCEKHAYALCQYGVQAVI